LVKTQTGQKTKKIKKSPQKKTAAAKIPADKRKNTITFKKSHKPLKSLPVSESSFHLLFEHMNSCVAIYEAKTNGKDFIIKAFNKAAEKAENVDRKKIIGKSVLKVFPAVKDFGLFKVFQNVWKTGKPQHHPVSLYKDNRIKGWRENYIYKLPTGEIVAIYDDITEKKQMEEALIKKQSLLDETQKITKTGGWEYDVALRRMYWTDEVYKIYGVSKNFDPNNPDAGIKFYAPEDQKILSKAFWQAVKKGKPYDLELKLINAEGKALWVRTVGKPERGKNKIVRVFGNIVDITDLKKAELQKEAVVANLRESENFLASVFESIQDGISILDTKLNIIGLNETHKRWYMHKSPLVGKKCYQAYHDRDKPCSDCPSRKTIRTGKPAHKIVPKEAEGKIIGWLEIYSFPLKDSASGEIRGVIEYVRDISERKQAEKELEKEKFFNQTLIRKSPAFFVAIGTDGKTIMMNDSLLRALGYAEEEVIGADYLNTFVAEPDREKLVDIFRKLTKLTKSTINENFILTKAGRQLLVEWHGQPVFKENGRVDYFFGVGIDITERRHAEEMLKNSEEKYRLTFASTSDIIFTLDTKLQITNITPSVKKILGLDEEDLIGKHIADLTLLTPDSVKKGVQYTKQIISGKFVPPVVYEFIGKDKTIRFVEVTASPIIRGNKIIGVTCVARNITDRVNTENILKESEENFRRSLDESPLGIRIVTANGETIYANEAILNIYGYKTIEELNKTPVKDRYTPDSYVNYQARKTLRDERKESPSEYEISIVRKNDEIRHLEVFRKEITWNGKKQFQVVYHDITKQKAAEQALHQSEQKHRTIIASIQEGYFEVDVPGNYTFVNEANCKMLGYTMDELIGMNYRQHMNKETAQKLLKPYTDLYQTGKPIESLEVESYKKDGTKVIYETSVSLIRNPQGNPIGFRGVSRDITARKQTEEALKESEEKYRTILETMEEGYYEVDLKGNTTFVNDAMCRIQGYSREELIGMNNRQYTRPETAERVYRIFNEVYKTEVPSKIYENAMIRKDGSRIWTEASITLRKDASGKIIGFKGIVRDISASREIKNALKESEEKYRTILETMEEGYYEVDLAGNTTYANDAMCRIHGYSREELIGMNYRRYTSPDTADDIYKEYNNVYKTEIPSKGYNHKIIKKDGAERILDLSFALRKDASGRKIGFQGMVRDITDQKRAEDTIKERDLRFRKLSFHVQGMIYQFKRNADGTYCLPFTTDAINHLFGCSTQDVLDDISPITKVVLPDDLGLFMDSIETSAKNMTIWECEFRVQLPGQPVKWMFGQSTPEKLTDGSIIWHGFVTDITERKQAQEKIIENEKRLKEAQACAHIGSWEFSLNMQENSWSEEMFRMLEFDPASGVPPFDIYLQKIHPDDRNRIGINVPKSVSEKIPYNSEYRVILSDGSVHWIESQGAPIFDENGKMIKYSGTAQDITERKTAEEELRKKHEELETMIESSPVMIYFKDLNNRFIRVNKAVFEVSGLSKEEMEGKSNEEINPRQAERFLEEDRKIIATGKPLIGNVETIKTKKGQKILRTDKVPHKDKNGNIVGIIGFSVDITEQKKAQDALIASEEKYRSLVENAQEGFYQTTAEGKFITINKAFARILGYNFAQEVLKSVTDIPNQLYVYPQDRERLIKLVGKYGSVTNFETQLYRKDGSRVWLSLSANAALDDQKRVLYYQGMIQDISEKKHIEVERLENVKRLRKALGATINAMAVTVETRDPYTAGHQRRVADLARAIATEMKLTSDQIDGVRMASMIHDIGKISIPSEILTKPTQLSALEYNLIKTHPDSGYSILKDIEFPWPIARIVLEHHERVNGSGYPRGLKENDILIESKILAVADVVEAISSHRPYRAAHGIEAGLQEITKNKDILYDAKVVNACLRLFREKSYTLAA
jgi:PAS domain S-box-containing protein